MDSPSDRPPFLILPRGLAPLGYRDFALFWIGLVVSNTGRWIEMTGMVWLVYELTDSPFLLGLLGVVRAAPIFVLSPIAGVVADRALLKHLLFVTQALALLNSLWLGILILTGHVVLWEVYLQVALQATITAFDTAVRQALFPQLVPRLHLSKSVTLNITATRISKLVGPAAGGIAIAQLGEASPFLLNAASFLGLMGAILLMRHMRPRTSRIGTTFRGELVEGFRHVLSAPVIAGLFKMEIVFGVFQINPVIVTIVGREVLGVGPERLGVLLAAPALGAFVGLGWMLFLREPDRQGRFSIMCTFAYAAALACFGASGNFAGSFAALAAVGMLDVLVTVTRNSIMQLSAPAPMRGRVMANIGMVTRGIGPLAETQSGLLAGAIGPTTAVATAGLALAGAAALTARLNPALWRFSKADIDPDPPSLTQS